MILGEIYDENALLSNENKLLLLGNAVFHTNWVRTYITGNDTLTSVDEILTPHNCSTIAETLRVDTPCTYISASVRVKARSLRSPFSSACG